MSYYSKIEQALETVEASVFESVISRIVSDKYNSPADFTHIGKVSGKNKTRKGTPDIYFKTNEGKYVFVEITTQEQNLKTKITSDINKCKDKAQELECTVEKVIYACTSKCDVADIDEFIIKCKEFCNNENPFEFWSIDYIANELSISYQNVASELLNIPVPYGTIKTLDKFISSFDASQNHDFLYRIDEIAKIKATLNEKVVLLYGKAGCGKTRLALEVARQLKEDKQIVECYGIRGSDSSLLISDLTTVGDEKILCILDDVNRMPFFKECIEYVLAHTNIKIIATVRDYAFDSIQSDLIRNTLHHYVSCERIEQLNSEQQQAVIGKVLNNQNRDAMQNILNVSSGNLRFAVMCAEVVNGGKATPKTVEEVLEEYFIQKNQDLISLEKEKRIDGNAQTEYKICLLLTALKHRIVDIEVNSSRINTHHIDFLEKSFGIKRERFIDAMLYWVDKEIVDISQNGRVFEIADQILANYLFHKFVFIDKIVSLKDIFINTFPLLRSRIIEMFQSIISIYGYSGTAIEIEMTDLWQHYKSQDDKNTIEFIGAFFSLLPIDALIYAQEKISNNPNDLSFFNIALTAFESPEYEVATDILLTLISANQIGEDKMKSFIERIGVSQESWYLGLAPQIYLLNAIKERFSVNDFWKEIFIKIAKHLINFSFSHHAMNLNSMTIHNIEIVPADFVYVMRRIIWQGLVELYSLGFSRASIFKLLNSNARNPISMKKDKLLEVIKEDRKSILDLIKGFNVITYSDKKFVKLLLECGCDSNDMVYVNKMNELSGNDAIFSLYLTLHQRERDIEHDIEKKSRRYREIFGKANVETILNYYLIEYSDGKIKDIGLFQYFEIVKRDEPVQLLNRFKELLNAIPNLQYPIEYDADFFDFFLNDYSAVEIYKIIDKSVLREKDAWKLAFFQALCNKKQEQINDAFYYKCLDTIERYNFNGSYSTFYYLLPFEEYKAGFVLELFKRFNEAYDKDKKPIRLSIEFFYGMNWDKYGYGKISVEKIEQFFGEEVESVYYQTYFKLIVHGHTVASKELFIKHIGNKDIKYLYQYYQILLETNSEWLKDDVIKDFPNKIDNCVTIFENFYKHQIETKKYFYLSLSFTRHHFIAKAFDINEFEELVKKLYKSEFMQHKDARHEMNSLILELPTDYQNIFYKETIANLTPEEFKNLRPFEVNHWSGGTAGMYEKTIARMTEFLKQLPNSSNTIKYRAIIEESIKQYQKYLPEVRLQDIHDFDF